MQYYKFLDKLSINNNYLIVITGPTAVGKTSVAIAIAESFSAEIISSDSRQFYKEMNIGTAKPTAEELKTIRHHFINSLSIHDDYSAGDFEREGLQLLDKIYQSSNVAILTGGSGLYIKALCEGFDSFPEIPEEVVTNLKKEYESRGITFLQEELLKYDPDYYDEVDIQNSHRLIRALSVIRVANQPYTSFLHSQNSKRNFRPIYIILNRERAELYQRINDRVDQMLVDGLVEEARALYPFKSLNSLQTVGYQELFSHFDGKTDLITAISLIKRNSRRYAKRQLTWFRKMEDVHWYHPDEMERIISAIRAELYGGKPH